MEAIELEAIDQSTRYKNSYASEVSRRQYLNHRTADIFFVFDDPKKPVPAHKAVLSAGSKVFDVMFYGDMAEKKNEIYLYGKSAEAFKIFLQFCYLDEVVLKPDTITDVMSLLNEYDVTEGLAVCGRFMADDWTFDNICLAYEWAINFQMEEHLMFCERKIGIYAEEIFKTDGFLSCSFNILDHILSMDSLLCVESVVLDACLDWARHKCTQNSKDVKDMEKLREYLMDQSNGKNLLYKIRYGSITNAEFSKYSDEFAGLFANSEEYEDVIRLQSKSNDLKTGKFSTEPRKPWNKHALESDLLPNENFNRSEFTSERIVNVVTVNDFMLLHGFYNVDICAKDDSSRSFPVELSIQQRKTQNEEPKVVYNNRLIFEANKEQYHELNPAAIILKPNFEYHFEFVFESSNFEYLQFEITPEIKVIEHISIQIPSKCDNNDRFILDKFNLSLLK